MLELLGFTQNDITFILVVAAFVFGHYCGQNPPVTRGPEPPMPSAGVDDMGA